MNDIKKQTIFTAAKGACILVILICCCVFNVSGEESGQFLRPAYDNYQQRFNGIHSIEDMEPNGFHVIENQVFSVYLETFGDVTFVPVMEEHYSRLAIFLIKENGEIVYRTDQLEANSQKKGQLAQPNKGLSAVSFQDLDGDKLTDVILISTSVRDSGKDKGQIYKVGDVLFQSSRAEKKQGTLYRDYRLSNKVNEYNMNKSIGFISSYVKDGYSTEFLYTAITLTQLQNHGFQVIPEQTYWKQFEKMGRLKVVSGTYSMAEYSVFMVYLVNEQGYIVWSFQPMGNYEHLYGLKGVKCTDIDGDGLKDIVILASYSLEGDVTVISSDYSVYYQGNSGFTADTELKSHYSIKEEDTMEQVIEKARAYWGWRSET